MYFSYGKRETICLSQKDVRLGEVIRRVGHIERAVDDDLFSSVVHHIIGQQISTKAQQTIWQRMNDAFGDVTAETIGNASVDELQSLGMTFRKAEYIKDLSLKIINGEKGIGVWTAEMILLFCLQRPNILSFDDLAIQRGMRMVYHHRRIDRKLFEKYRRRLSPFCSVASLYFWAVAGGALPDMKDYAPERKRNEKSTG